MTTFALPHQWSLPLLRQRLADYVELTKPRLTALVLVTVAAGFWLGLNASTPPALLIPLLCATALAVGGANALNQWSERGPDGLMQRTKRRPLPSGRLASDEACCFGLLLCVAGVLWLAVSVNGLAAALTTLSIASYVLLYTPLKRVTPLCTLVGAVPGALPPMIGWAAARQTLSIEAWALFAILFVWQLPHFLAIAFLYRDDYAQAGFQMLPVVDREGTVAARALVLYAFALVPVSLFPAFLGMASPVYFAGAFLLSTALLLVSIRAALRRSMASVRQLFLASVLYLPLLLGILSLTKLAPPTPAAQALARYGAVPSFALIDQQERPVTRETFQGRVWIADFIFTSCAGQCLLMSDALHALQQAFPNERELAFVSFSVDPVRDTPKALAAYATRYGADARWTLVTGGREALTALCTEGFHLALGEQPESLREPILHSVRLVLVDRGGHIRGYYDATDGGALSRLRRDTERLLREPLG